MADFYAIITNFGTAPKPRARLDVAVDTLAAGGNRPDVLFNVFDVNGTQLAEFTVPTNENGCASTAARGENDLFALSNGAPALVRARTPAAATMASAALHQLGLGNKLSLAIPPTTRNNASYGMGTVFSVAVGDVPAPTLLIANVSGGDQGVDVFIGTRGAPGAGVHSNPRIRNNGIWRVDLAAGEKIANVIVAATGSVIVQLVIDPDGQRVSALTCLPTA